MLTAPLGEFPNLGRADAGFPGSVVALRIAVQVVSIGSEHEGPSRSKFDHVTATVGHRIEHRWKATGRTHDFAAQPRFTSKPVPRPHRLRGHSLAAGCQA